MGQVKNSFNISDFFLLSDFKFDTRWNEALIINTNQWVKFLSEEISVFTTSRHFGLLTLISNENDHWGIKSCIDKNKHLDRYCKELIYEGVSVFLFVQNQRIVSIVVDPCQFLDRFDCNLLAMSLKQTDLETLGVSWEAFNQWSVDEKKERIASFVQQYKEQNLTRHLLFNCIQEVYRNLKEQDNASETMFDLLPTILILFDLASVNVGKFILSVDNQFVSRGSLFDLNQYCLCRGKKFSMAGGLFVGPESDAYEDFVKGKFFKSLIALPEIKKRSELISEYINKKTKNVKLSNKASFTPRIEIVFESIFSFDIDKKNDSFDIFCELVGRRILTFFYSPMNRQITKLLVKDDLFYAFLKDYYCYFYSSQEYKIYSFFFQYRLIIKLLHKWFCEHYKSEKWIKLLCELANQKGLAQGSIAHRDSKWSELDNFVFHPDPVDQVENNLSIVHTTDKPWCENKDFQDFIES